MQRTRESRPQMRSSPARESTERRMDADRYNEAPGAIIILELGVQVLILAVLMLLLPI
jgi:hypothetical protein